MHLHLIPKLTGMNENSPLEHISLFFIYLFIYFYSLIQIILILLAIYFLSIILVHKHKELIWTAAQSVTIQW